MHTTNHGALEAIPELKGFWRLLFHDSTMPDDAQWALWLLRHDSGVVRKAIVELVTKHRRLNGKMDLLYMHKYCSGVMNRLTREQPARI